MPLATDQNRRPNDRWSGPEMWWYIVYTAAWLVYVVAYERHWTRTRVVALVALGILLAFHTWRQSRARRDARPAPLAEEQVERPSRPIRPLDYRSPEDDETDEAEAEDAVVRRYYREPPSGDAVLYVLLIPVAVAIMLLLIRYWL